MNTISSVVQLRASIKVLEERQIREKEALKDELKATGERLKPVNLIKNALQDYAQTPDLNETLGLAAGFVAKKAVTGTSDNPVKQLIGNLLQMGVAKLVSNNTDNVRNTLLHWAEHLLKKRSDKK